MGPLRQALRHARIPVAIAMAGGYAERVDDIVDIHFATVSCALERFGQDAEVEPRAGKPRLKARAATC